MEIRCMPAEIHNRIIDWLTKNQERPILTQAALPAEPSFSGLCNLVASADFIISTDTAMVHLADAFSRPCLAFFTTHRPEWRVRDYPHCHAVYLPSGLPEALEFARDTTDITRAKSAWWPHGSDLRWLDCMLADTFAKLEA
jgi:ADP-heptose:LPS heptosyltransferase